MKLTRSIAATVRRPGTGEEAAFAAGFKGHRNAYARQFPDAFKAGQQAAREAAARAARRDPMATGTAGPIVKTAAKAAKPVNLAICVSGDGEAEFFLLNNRQFKAACNAADAWDYVGARYDKLTRFATVKGLTEHLAANNLTIGQEISGLIY